MASRQPHKLKNVGSTPTPATTLKESKMEPQKGMLAYCSRGELGIITVEQPIKVTYSDESKGIAWVGLHLVGKKLGKPWSSRNPNAIGFPQDLARDKAAQDAVD